ncbi:MAG: ABC transporter ATP-binding protein [Xanthomonadales bacterium]|nr:ABC transporter ATP-binding protein [Xanthomonadales bacterium]
MLLSHPIPQTKTIGSFFPELRRYVAVFQRFVGTRMYWVFALMLLSAVLEGFGIVMLLPLLKSLGEGAFGRDPLTHTLSNWLGALGATSPVGILLLIFALYLLKGLVFFAATAMSGRLRAYLQRDLQARLYDQYSQMDYLYYTRRDTGHFFNVMNQVHAFVHVFYSFSQFLIGLLTTMTYLVMGFVVAWAFGLMAVVVGGAILLLLRRFNRLARTLSIQTAEEQGFFSKAFIESIQSFKYLAATGQAKPLRTAAMGSVDRMTSLQDRQNLAIAFTTALREPLAVGAIVLIVIVQIGLLEQPLAPILVSILLFHRGVNSVIGLQGSWQVTLMQIGAVDLVEREFDQLERQSAAPKGQPVAPLQRQIQFRSVSFSYGEGQKPALNELDLTIPALSTVAIVGASGAGKSTLIDTLTLLLKPDAGALYIDDLSAEQIDPSSWREQIGYVLQDTVIFDASIADNISLWGGDVATDSDLRSRITEAVHAARLGEFVDALPEGLNTLVGDRGIRLSGGQRQRLFIARELFKRPRLLILDEATSSLDADAERAIQESLEQLRGQLTVIIIAHRLATVRQADQIHVLEQGRVVESGSFDQLNELTDGRFRRMVELQSL